jgi:hypothetical protein
VDIIYCGFGDGDTVWKDPEDVVPVPGNCEVKGTLPLPDGRTNEKPSVEKTQPL